MAKKAMKEKQQRKQKFSTREYNRCRICGRPHAYLRKYGTAKRSDFLKIVGDHLSEKQLRRFVELFKESGILISEGQRGHTTYRVADKYLQSNDIMNKALAIGLRELKDKGEI